MNWKPLFETDNIHKIAFQDGSLAYKPTFEAAGSGGVYYDGEYEVEPDFTDQILETKEKTMRENVTVRQIRVARTANQYGTTVYIGRAI